MIRTRFAAILTSSAVAAAVLAGAAPAHAAGYPFTDYNERFLDVGPVVYSIHVEANPDALDETEQVVVQGKSIEVYSDWVISQESISSKVDDGADGTSYPELPTIHVGYWTARYAAKQFDLAEDRYLNGSTADVEAFYRQIATTPTGEAQAYFAASDAKAARISAVKADVQRNSDKAWAYMIKVAGGKHGGPGPYLHAHKAQFVKVLNKKFTKSKLYKGSVKVAITKDFLVKMGPTKADYDRYVRFRVTVRDDTDKVAYAIDMNTHDGGAYGVHKVKY